MSTSDAPEIKVFIDMPCSDGRFIMGAVLKDGYHRNIWSLGAREGKTLVVIDGKSWETADDFRFAPIEAITERIASKLQKESAS